MRPSLRSVIATAGIGVALLVFTASCSSDGVTAPAAPAARAPQFTSLELTPSSFTLFTFEPLKTVQLSTVTKDHRTVIVTGVRSFSSSDLNVATVDASGLVTAVAPGTADISVTVTIEGVTKTAATVVTVSANQIASAGQIAFSRPAGWTHEVGMGGSGGIFVSKPDGSDLVRVTTGEDATPVWSPDGSRLAFVRYERPWIPNVLQSIQPYLCVIGNGSPGQRCISTTGITRPAWSPDGSELAFIGYTQAGETALFATDLEYTRVITKLNEASGCWGNDVSWSSSNRIAIAHCNDISTLNPDGSGLQVLTRPVPDNFATTGVAWSPDGQSLAVAFEQSDCWDLCDTVLGRLNANGTQFTILFTHEYGRVDHPSWSPDGTKIVYAEGYGVWFALADGSAGSARFIILNRGYSPSWGR
jgi:WD40 repeat protein